MESDGGEFARESKSGKHGEEKPNEKIFIMENCAEVVCENCCVKRSRAAGVGELKRMRNLIIFVSFMFTLLTRQHFLASESVVLRSPLGIFTVGLSSSFFGGATRGERRWREIIVARKNI